VFVGIDDEEALGDGDGQRAVRVGDTVRRPGGWWSATVQELLGHLRDQGFAYAPVPLGFDDDGREMTSYIVGDHGAACWDRTSTDAGIHRFGRLLREYHDAAATFSIPADAQWKLPPQPGADAIVCHGDFAPWNIVWHGDDPVGIIDWEFARPRSRFDDLAWAAVWSVPLRSDDEAVTGWDCWEAVPDRPRRLELLIDGYGDGSPDDVVDRAVVVLRQTRRDVQYLANLGLEPQRMWVADGSADQDLERAEWIVRHRRSLVSRVS
jgi:hypothetical protein